MQAFYFAFLFFYLASLAAIMLGDFDDDEPPNGSVQYA